MEPKNIVNSRGAQILAKVGIRETINHPRFEGSNFTAMMETAFLRSETTDTIKADAVAERTITDEISLEEKLEFPT